MRCFVSYGSTCLRIHWQNGQDPSLKTSYFPDCSSASIAMRPWSRVLRPELDYSSYAGDARAAGAFGMTQVFDLKNCGVSREKISVRPARRVRRFGYVRVRG